MDSKYLQIEVLNRIAGLEMRARRLVEGTLAGLQPSPYRGVSAEFAEHRSYTPGDDTRHIDWRVYARTQKYFIRQYQEETNFVVTFLLDCSESMSYGPEGNSKLDYACLLTACLSHLVLHQSDAVSLALFSDKLMTYLPPRTSRSSLVQVLQQMERIEPRGTSTALGNVLAFTGEMLSRRGIIILISDLLDDELPMIRGLQRLHFAHHEVVVCHVIDPAEAGLDYQGRLRFKGLENTGVIQCEVDAIQAAYVEVVLEFLHRIKQKCTNARADYVLANTGEPVDKLLIRYLTMRQRAMGVRR